MVLPDKSHPAWQRLITNQHDYTFKFLATKMILGRLAIQYKYLPTEPMMDKAIEELYTFFEANKHLPFMQDDLKTIFGKGVNL